MLADSTITNSGSTTITGDVGLSPGTSITGLTPGNVNGTIHTNDGVALQAQTDASAAYTFLQGQAVTTVLTGQDLGDRTLTPGVYFFSTTAQLTGALILDGQGQASPLFIFQIGSTLTTAVGSSITGINGANGGNAYFQIGSSATLGVDSTFIGTLIASTSITLNDGASLEGRALALEGAVTLDDNTITVVPEPATTVLALGGAALLFSRKRR